MVTKLLHWAVLAHGLYGGAFYWYVNTAPSIVMRISAVAWCMYLLHKCNLKI
jgi:hypothetical protein